MATVPPATEIPREDKHAIRSLRLRARRQQDRGLLDGCRHRSADAAGRAAGRRRAVGDGDQPRPAHALCRTAHRAGDLEFSHRPGERRADACWGRSRRRTRRRFSPRTARAGICCRPIIKAGAPRSIHLGADGAVGAPSQDWLATATGAHAISTDPSNQYAFVPHIARIQDNVLEPPKDNPGPNVIMQFRFDTGTGRLAAELAVPGRARGTRRPAPLLLSSHPESRLFLQRAGLQRHRLSA